MTPATCAEIDQVSDALALGTLGGDERARAIAHLDSCSRCRGVVRDLARAGEAVLLVAPEAQPPAGFESSVLAAVATTGAPGPRSRRGIRTGLVAAVAVAVALAGGVVAGRVTASGDRGAAVALARYGRSTCRAVVVPGDPAELVVTIDGPARPEGSEYVVEAEPSSHPGTTETVGSFTVVDGHGTLVAPLSAGVDRLRSIRVFKSGQLRYEARF